MASNSKQYGLIMPKKANQGLIRPRPSVFEDNSDSGDEGNGGTDWVKKALKRGSERGFQRKQVQLDVQRAIDEDPTVYQYDEIYEKIEEKKTEMLTKKKLDKKPRYIQSLLLQAEKRKRENERRNERIIQKEREAEGDQFKDKEAFVTSAYRQKLEEFKKMEEEEKRQDALEALTDVSKQQDLSGFYRHLYRVTTGDTTTVKVKQENEDTPESEIINKVEEPEKTSDVIVDEITSKDNCEKDLGQDEKATVIEDKPDDTGESKSGSRHYRKRRDSSASSASDSSDDSNKKVDENLDADSDFSVDSSSSDSDSSSSRSKTKIRGETKTLKERESKTKKKSEKLNTGKDKQSKEDPFKEPAPVEKRKTTEVNENDNNKKSKKDDTTSEKKTEKDSETKVVPSENKVKEPKPNIWEKRTVGEVFENALQRYYQRKASKLAVKG